MSRSSPLVIPTPSDPGSNSASPPPSRGGGGIDHFQLIVVFHYVLAALTASKALFGIPFLVWGLPSIQADAPSHSEVVQTTSELLADLQYESDPILVGLMLVMTGASVISLSLIHGVALAYIGRCLSRRTRRATIVVFSWFDLMYLPLGTGLSLYVIWLLRQPGVKEQFHTGRP